MDKIGLRELLQLGVKELAQALEPNGPSSSVGAAEDARVGSLLDRIAQVGAIAAEHESPEAWDAVLGAFAEIIQLGRPKNEGLEGVSKEEARFLLEVSQRLMFVGAYARVLGRFELVRSLTLLHPIDDYHQYFWSRYSVTMISRGRIGEWHKSLIGPASEFVRSRSEFFSLFKANMDSVVNAMCQFDFLQCVIVLLTTDFDDTKTYPNFGAYWNHRSIPIVKEIIQNDELRSLLNGATDVQLREAFLLLDASATRAFADYSGWSAGMWGDADVALFMQGEGSV